MHIRSLVDGQRIGVTDPLSARREQLLVHLATSAAPRGYSIALDLLRNRAEAEDAVQEALARACEACVQIRDPNAVEPWFYRVLTNGCLRVLRRRRLRRLVFGRSAEPDPETTEGPAATAEAIADTVSAERALSNREEIDEMLRGLDQLPVKQRVALLLRYGHDRSIADIAAMLDVKPATVKTHLVRGLRRLRKTMERLS